MKKKLSVDMVGVKGYPMKFDCVMRGTEPGDE